MIVTFYYANGAKRILRPQFVPAKGHSVRLLMEQLRHDFGADSFKIRF